MKRFLALMLAAVMVFSLTACGDKDTSSKNNTEKTTSSSKSKNKSVKFDSYEEITLAITEDKDSTFEEIKTKIDAINENVTDFDGYTKNTDKIAEWYAFSIETSQAFYVRLQDYVVQYYRLILKIDGIKDYKTWDRAMSDIYDAWNDAMDDYYKSWNRLFDDVYDFYNDIIDDAHDDYDYDTVSDAWDEMYDLHSDSWDDMYDNHSDAWSDMYDNHSDVWGLFYDGEDDIDSVLKLPESSSKSSDTDKESKESKDTSKDDSKKNKKSSDADYKEFWDTYEEFMNEYCEFMETYDSSDLSALVQYATLMEKYSEFAKAADERKDSDMSDEEAAYALQVESRVLEKLAAVQ